MSATPRRPSSPFSALWRYSWLADRLSVLSMLYVLTGRRLPHITERVQVIGALLHALLVIGAESGGTYQMVRLKIRSFLIEDGHVIEHGQRLVFHLWQSWNVHLLIGVGEVGCGVFFLGDDKQ